MYSLYPFTILLFFFFNDTATTEIYTLSLHDALPISEYLCEMLPRRDGSQLEDLTELNLAPKTYFFLNQVGAKTRSEEHTSELQSHSDLVCRLLLEKRRAHV